MKYSSENLVRAVNSGFSSIEAAKKFNVPERTIRAHRQLPLRRIGAGRPRYLNGEQENHLASLFQLLPDYGFELTADVALKISNDYMNSLGLKVDPKRKWLQKFVKRHHMKIKWRKQEKLDRIRAEKFTEKARQGWFSLLKSTLEKLDLMDKPNQIYNADETGFSDKTNRKYVIVNSSTRHAFEKNGGSGKKYTTALIAISAAGQVLPPFIIYSGKTLMDNWCKRGPTGAHYAVTDKGWINSWAFEYWLHEMFIPSTRHINRPLLLIVDGHAAHVNLNVIHLLKENQIVCLMLPPHSTHCLQPIDVVLYNNVKTDWTNIVKKSSESWQ